MSVPMCTCSPALLAKLARFISQHPETREDGEEKLAAAFLTEHWASLSQDDRENVAIDGLNGALVVASYLLGEAMAPCHYHPDDVKEAERLLLELP